MKSWHARPTEVANLLNPAFCGYLLMEYVKQYEVETGTGVPYELMFLLLPVVLHKPTRECLPSSTRTHFPVWLQRHPEIRIDFANRVKDLIEITKESIFFLMKQGFLEVKEGRFCFTKKRYRRFVIDDEIKELKDKSKFVARWYSGFNSTTIFILWGICP
jgi:hypothetical protein